MQIKRTLLSVTSATLLFVSASFAGQQTWTGEISDNMCGANHQAMAKQGQKVNPRECTLECVKGGSKFVFVSKGQVYDINNQDLPDLKQHAGHKVELTGDLASDKKTITVAKIQMAH